MKNKELGYIVLVLSIIVIWIWLLVFIDNYMVNDKNFSINNGKVANNVENNIQENSSNISLGQWKKDQIKNYKFATNLKFWTW